MRNQRPIFINGFSRGGTNILMNLLLSHPEVCIPTGETHKVFKGRAMGESSWQTARKRLCYDLPIRLAVMQDLFDPFLIRARRKVSRRIQHFIDRILYREKIRARHESHNRYKCEGIEYDQEEIAASRLLCKSVNGVIYTTDMFSEMYPGAVFFGLVRNGLAVCEGHIRRGRTAEQFARIYQPLCTRMLQDAERLDNYHVIRFEDIIATPVNVLQRIYHFAELETGLMSKVRLQLKRTVDQSGQHRLAAGYDRQVVWYDLGNLDAYFQKDINENQINRLAPSDRDSFLAIAGEAMERLGYL